MRPAELYEKFVNPQWTKLLDVLQMNVDYVRCQGGELFTEDGKRLLDFNAGYCTHNVGHNHPAVIAALKAELDRHGPAMLQSHVSDLAGELAARLCGLAGGRLARAYFASSGNRSRNDVNDCGPGSDLGSHWKRTFTRSGPTGVT